MSGDSFFQRCRTTGRLEGERKRATFFREKDRLGPGIGEIRLRFMMNPTQLPHHMIINHAVLFDRATSFHRIQYPSGTLRLINSKTDFVEIKSFGFPVLMETQKQIRYALPFQPCSMRPRFVGLLDKVVAIQIQSVLIVSRLCGHSRGIQHRTDQPIVGRWSYLLLHQHFA